MNIYPGLSVDQEWCLVLGIKQWTKEGEEDINQIILIHNNYKRCLEMISCQGSKATLKK